MKKPRAITRAYLWVAAGYLITGPAGGLYLWLIAADKLTTRLEIWTVAGVIVGMICAVAALRTLNEGDQ